MEQIQAIDERSIHIFLNLKVNPLVISYLSYGLGDRVKENDIEEFKAIAKVCSQTFYGSYFNKKAYTTREEFLMMMFTLFDENITFDGEFTDDGEYIP